MPRVSPLLSALYCLSPTSFASFGGMLSSRMSNTIFIFRFAEGFSLVLLMASMLMIVCQLALLYLYVTIKQEKKEELLKENANEIKESFWKWRYYSDYLQFICMIAFTVGLMTVFFHQNPVFQLFLAYTSSSVEAILGIPQFYLNYQRKNTSGLSIVLILIWLGGDLYKLSYYVAHSSPFALQFCSFFQIIVDICILG